MDFYTVCKIIIPSVKLTIKIMRKKKKKPHKAENKTMIQNVKCTAKIRAGARSSYISLKEKNKQRNLKPRCTVTETI